MKHCRYHKILNGITVKAYLKQCFTYDIFDEYNEFYESVMAWGNNCSQQY